MTDIQKLKIQIASDIAAKSLQGLYSAGHKSIYKDVIVESAISIANQIVDEIMKNEKTKPTESELFNAFEKIKTL